MEDQRLIPALILLALIMAGPCGALLAADDLEAVLKRKAAQMTPAGRGRGNKLLKMTAETIQAEDCAIKQLPFFRLVASEVHPEQIRPGGSFNHRFAYALCPRAPGETARATLTKRISYAGAVVLSDAEASYLLRPGTWADDDVIEVPANAPKGRYTVEIEITLDQAAHRTHADFLVD
jgi:hypothetical protein